MSSAKNLSLVCFKMILPILNLIRNEKMWLTSICSASLSFLSLHYIFWLTNSNVMTLASEREIVADNGMLWLTHPSHLE